MNKKGILGLLNPVVLGTAVVIVAAFLLFNYFQDDSVYPDIKTKYDFKEVHLYHFNNIVELYSDGRVDGLGSNHGYIEDRPYQFIVAHLVMFENTGDQAYLDQAVKNLNIIETRCQTDSDNNGFDDCKGYYWHDGTHRTAGWVADMFARGAYIIEKHEVDEYLDDAARWGKLVDEEFFPYFETTWTPYEVNGEKLGYYLKDSRGIAQQFNRVSGVGSAYIWRWKATEDDKFKDVPERMLNRYFNERVNPRLDFNGTPYISVLYSWYDPSSGEAWYCDPSSEAANGYLCDGKTDSSHLNYEFEFIMVGYEEGLITEEELRLVSNSIKVMMSAGEGKVGDKSTPLLYDRMAPPRKMYLDEATERNIYRQTGTTYNFIRLGAMDEDLFYDFEEILHNNELSGQLNGNYFSEYYRCVKDPQNNFVEFCASDGEYRVEPEAMMLTIANAGRFQ